MKIRARYARLACGAIAVLALAVSAPRAAEPRAGEEKIPSRALARPHSAPESIWISLSGTVAEANARTLTLDYGAGTIPVTLAGREWPLNDLPIQTGERITVHGRIDEDLFEGRGIVAQSLYVPDQSTYYQPDRDFRGGPVGFLWFPAQPPGGSRVSVSGIVASIDGRELMLDAGSQRLRVDTRSMPIDPLERSGAQQIEAGDPVWVSGVLDLDFVERREIHADQIVRLTQDERTRGEPSGQEGPGAREKSRDERPEERADSIQGQKESRGQRRDAEGRDDETPQNGP